MPKRICDRAVWSVFPHKCNSAGNYQKSSSFSGSLLNQYNTALNGIRELPLFCGDQPYGTCANLLRKKISTRIDIDPPGGVGVAAANNNNNTNADPSGGVVVPIVRGV